MKPVTVLALVLLSTMLFAQPATDESALRKIIPDQVAAWNKGDAEAYSQCFATDGTFTNILGMFYTGHDGFRERHDQIFKGVCSAERPSRRMLFPSGSGARMLRS